jgi:hypothetical protein
MSLMSAPATAMHGQAQQTPVPSRLVHVLFYHVAASPLNHMNAQFGVCSRRSHQTPSAVTEDSRAQAQMTPTLMILVAVLHFYFWIL